MFRSPDHKTSDRSINLKLKRKFIYTDFQLQLHCLVSIISIVANVIYRPEKKPIILFHFRCSSNIGRVGGEQTITIGLHCLVLGTVEHETMHSLGMIHEHSRPDRDKYVDIKWKNINECKLSR